MTISTTVTPEGEIVQQTIEGRKAYVNFTRSLPPHQYHKAEASCHLQVDLPEHDGESAGEYAAEVTAAIKEAFAVAKVNVFDQLGLSYEVDAVTQVVKEDLEATLGAVEVNGGTKSNVKPFKRAAKPAARKSAKPSDAEIADAWAELANNPDRWWDNRDDKRNPKAPDFKHKDTGFALWLDTCPDEALLP